MILRIASPWLPVVLIRCLAGAFAGGFFCSSAMNAQSEKTTLVDLWHWSIEHEPGYQMATSARRAGEADAVAIGRERLPTVSVAGAGDFGQRARPGEEREQGVAARGDLLARVDWIVRDSARGARERAVALRRAGVVETEAAFDLSFRAELARTYLQTAIAVERHSILTGHFDRFDEVSSLARLRVERGVESAVALEWLETARTRHRAELERSRDRTELGSMTLAAYAGREVEPAPLDFDVAEIGWLHVPPIEKGAPSVAALEREAEVLRAEADVLREQDRWRVGAFAAGGPYFSKAFSDGLEPEYIGGIQFVWTPDVTGVRESRASAFRHRAGALQAEAQSEARRLGRRAAEIARLGSSYGERERELRDAVERAAALERTSLLRWQNGVGGWRDLLDSREARLRAELAQLDWRAAFALEIVEYAEITNRLDSLPGWLGQGKDPSL
jgi:outer membrane protein TolC